MNYLGHLIFGIILGSIFILIMNNISNWFTFSFLNLILYILIIFLFSLLPDIDHENSKLTWIFLGLGVGGLLYGIFLDYKILIISIIFISLTFFCAKLPHRGITHRLIFGGLLALPLWFYFGLPEYLLSLVAFQSHIWGDGYLFRLW